MKFIMAVVVLLGSVGGAWANDLFTPQKAYNAGVHFGRINFVATRCKNLSISPLTLASSRLFIVKHKNDFARGMVSGIADSKRAESNAKRRGVNAKEITCATGLILYGPNGLNMKNGLIEAR